MHHQSLASKPPLEGDSTSKNQTRASPVKQQLEHQSMNNIGNTSNVQNGEYQYQLNGSDLEISTDLKSRTIPEILPMVLEDH